MNKKGFTLIELVITIMIIAILVGISYPAYSEYLTRVRRAAAVGALLDLAGRMEEYYTVNDKYLGATLDTLGVHDENYKNFYSLSINAKSDEYTLSATPINNQFRSDIKCGELSIDQIGNKKISGSGDPEECWQ